MNFTPIKHSESPIMNVFNASDKEVKTPTPFIKVSESLNFLDLQSPVNTSSRQKDD